MKQIPPGLFSCRWERGRAAGLELAKMEDISFAKIKQRQQAEIKEELYHADKQLTMVRREALRHLLRTEHLQYQLELNHLGKSFSLEAARRLLPLKTCPGIPAMKVMEGKCS
uniref:Uncharacterized protein n=1 Tax=Sphaerodactylus townsendi TaxID=933632 RepID=A0ACB8GD89_9SAUR